MASANTREINVPQGEGFIGAFVMMNDRRRTLTAKLRGKYQFIEGVMFCREPQLRPGLVRVMRQFGAEYFGSNGNGKIFVQASPERRPVSEISGIGNSNGTSQRTASNGTGDDDPEGRSSQRSSSVHGGQEGPASPTDERLAEALTKLDPEDDSHWTQNGLPKFETVCKLYGSTDITRSDIDKAAPGLTRDTLLKSSGKEI